MVLPQPLRCTMLEKAAVSRFLVQKILSNKKQAVQQRWILWISPLQASSFFDEDNISPTKSVGGFGGATCSLDEIREEEF